MSTSTTNVWIEEESLVGAGGFGLIRLYVNRGDRLRRLAVKECKSQNMTETMKGRWKNECEIMMKLDHPYIVKCVNLPDELKELNNLPNPVLPMEYCNCGDLRKELSLAQNMYGLEEHQVKAIVHDISSAIQYLHELSIFHRDIKPENIVLNKLPGCRMVYKIIDLGYAKEVSQDSICTSFVGTIQYLAPELVNTMNSKYTGSVDFWSLGTTIFECISGFRPFMCFTEMMQWLDIVKKKKDSDIYAYVVPPNSISFSEHLPNTNKLSCVTRTYFEAWLRMMLTFDPKKRGGPCSEEDGISYSYKLLETTFKHKPLHLFNPLTNESRFYDVVDNKSIHTVADLASLFANVPVEQLIVMTTTGFIPDQQAPLVNFCVPVNYDSDQECDNVDISLVLICSPGDLPEVKHQRGNRLDRLMNNPNNLDYSLQDQQKLCKYLTHYCWSIYRSFLFLLKSLEAIKLCLLREKSCIATLIKELNEATKDLQSKVQFFRDSVQEDVKMLKKLPSSSSVMKLMESWQKDCDKADEWDGLVDTGNSYVEKYNSTECKIAECLKCPSTGHAEREIKMKSHFECAQKLLESLKDSNAAKQKDTNKTCEIIQCLKSCEKEWGRLSAGDRTHIRTIVSLCNELIQLKTPVNELIKRSSSSCLELMACQKSRQQSIWNINANNQASLTASMDGMLSVDTQDLCRQGRVLIERVQKLLSEETQFKSILDTYDWSFIDQ